jgi:hypothetical protein
MNRTLTRMTVVKGPTRRSLRFTAIDTRSRDLRRPIYCPERDYGLLAIKMISLPSQETDGENGAS